MVCPFKTCFACFPLQIPHSKRKRAKTKFCWQGDVGPLYDVVSFHDGNHWNVVIDTSETGDLEKGVKLRPYSETREFSALTDADLLSVSVNVYDEGNVVQLVAVSSSHGTHVASMAAVRD